MQFGLWGRPFWPKSIAPISRTRSIGFPKVFLSLPKFRPLLAASQSAACPRCTFDRQFWWIPREFVSSSEVLSLAANNLSLSTFPKFPPKLLPVQMLTVKADRDGETPVREFLSFRWQEIKRDAAAEEGRKTPIPLRKSSFPFAFWGRNYPANNSGGPKNSPIIMWAAAKDGDAAGCKKETYSALMTLWVVVRRY